MMSSGYGWVAYPVEKERLLLLYTKYTYFVKL